MKYDIDSIKKRKEINNRIKKTVFIFIIILLYNIVLLYMSYIDKFDTPSFYIYKAYIISTESMQPTLKKGDVIVIKKVDKKDLRIDDIITFKVKGEVITHRIVEIDEVNGTYKTKGDNNNIIDDVNLLFEDIEGKEIIKIPHLGNIVSGLKNRIIIILTILICLIIYLNKIEKKEKSNATREKKKIEDQKFIGK